MKVLITGGAGFIGSHLSDEIIARESRGHKENEGRPLRGHPELRDVFLGDTLALNEEFRITQGVPF